MKTMNQRTANCVMYTTPEQIDQVMKCPTCGEPALDDVLAEVARLGRILVPSQCQTCGGTGEVTKGGKRPTAVIGEHADHECPPCGGSGKEWSRTLILQLLNKAHYAMQDANGGLVPEEGTLRALHVAVPVILDALAALAEDNE